MTTRTNTRSNAEDYCGCGGAGKDRS